MRAGVGSSTGEGALRRDRSRLVLHVAAVESPGEPLASSVFANRYTRGSAAGGGPRGQAQQQQASGAFVESHDTLLLVLVILVLLSIVGIVYVQRFYLASVEADQEAMVLPGQGLI